MCFLSVSRYGEDFWKILFFRLFVIIFEKCQQYFEKSEYVLEKISKNNKFFNFKKGYLPWELKDKTKKFNFGIMPFYFSRKYSKEQMEAISTKIYTYIEQGLPIIVTNKMSSISKFVKENNLGIILKNNNDILNIKKIIQKCDYDLLVKNIHKYRENNSMENKINKLINL